jgi:predicted transposase/invertase (TIGR01784 family)
MINRFNPLVDFVFKRIFGNEEDKDLLIDFLNSILQFPIPVNSVEILNPYIDKSALDDKLSILDIKARLNNGELVNIEVQIVNKYDVEKRSLYYWSKMYCGQITEGGKYKELNKAICINILDYDIFNIPKYHTKFIIKEDSTNIRMNDDLEIHFLEMKKFILEKIDINDKLTEWLLFLKDPNNQIMEEIMEREPKLKKALTVLDLISQSNEQRRLYEDRQKAIMDYNSSMDRALEKGMEKGMEKRNYEFAKAMLNDNEPIEKIIRYTGLSSDEIEKLK